MPNSDWLLRPLPVALATLVLSLAPVGLVVRHLQETAAASDAAIFATASGTIVEKLRLATLRHSNWLTVCRNRIASLPLNQTRLREDELPPFAWNRAPPQWLAIVRTKDSRVAWVNARTPPEIAVGEDLAAYAPLATLLRMDEGAPEDDATEFRCVPGQRGTLWVAARLRDGWLLGWLDTAALCGQPSIEVAGVPGAFAVAATEHGPTEIREGQVFWNVSIERGPRYATLLATPSSATVGAAGAVTAVLLASLAGFAARARLDTLRAHALRNALQSERELGRLRSQLVAMISHELRTPLSAIVSSADLLDAYEDRIEPRRKQAAVRQILESAHGLEALIGQVLLLGRLEADGIAAKPEPIELSELCASAAREVEAAHQARCPIETNARGCVATDRGLLRTILVNLLSNAMKFSATGATIRLEGDSDSKAWWIRIRDQGIGIPESDRRRIGSAFERGSNVAGVPGNGLGLAIVHRAASVLGGSVTLESGAAGGTIATLTVPHS